MLFWKEISIFYGLIAYIFSKETMTRGICFKKLGITKSRYICIYGEEEEEAFPCLDYWDI